FKPWRTRIWSSARSTRQLIGASPWDWASWISRAEAVDFHAFQRPERGTPAVQARLLPALRPLPRRGPLSAALLRCRPAGGGESHEPGVGVVQDPEDHGLVLVLAVEPDHGLGSGQPMEQPAPLAQDILDSVLVGDGGDRVARKRGRRVPADVGQELLDHR